MIRYSLPVALAVLLPAGAALAGGDCRVARDGWQPQEAVMRMAEASGWTIGKIGIDDGCYEVEGRDRDGRRFEATIDPATLRVIDLDRRGHDDDDNDDDDDDDDDDDGHGRRGAAPARAAAPSANGVFGNGAPPRARIDPPAAAARPEPGKENAR